MDIKTPILLIFASLLLSGCASSIPPTISNAPESAASLSQLRAMPQDYIGQSVRLGGRIIEVENHQHDSWISIVEQPLQGNGKPRTSDQSAGRFIARVKGFVDPAVFSKGRRITVAGRFERLQTRKIGDYDYRYAIIDADDYYLWPREPKVRYAPSNVLWPYSPWYGPYDYFPYQHYYHRRGELICNTKVCS